MHSGAPETLVRAQSGDVDALADLYRQHRAEVFAFALRRTGSWELAEDITHDVFVRAMPRLAKFEWRGQDIGAWLVTIARNLIADHYKKGETRRVDRRREPDWLLMVGDGADSRRLARPDSDPRVDPEQVLARAELARVLDGVLPMLTDLQRQVLCLRFGAGLTLAQTAAALGMELGAVKALQYRACIRLAGLLPEGYGPPGGVR